ncbi:MAG: PUR family DNA/RNA-binding protein [Tannerellaceae bacterium]|nr:PUR family DNA/RNA-binding protein [Tannerellaceae bacterium]
MEESGGKLQSTGDKEIIYSKAIKAGKRIYYLDVKKNLKGDLFLAITESKKVQSRNSTQVSFEKHKIFLYSEDFLKFMEGLEDVIGYISENTRKVETPLEIKENQEEAPTSGEEIKLQIEF